MRLSEIIRPLDHGNLRFGYKTFFAFSNTIKEEQSSLFEDTEFQYQIHKGSRKNKVKAETNWNWAEIRLINWKTFEENLQWFHAILESKLN